MEKKFRTLQSLILKNFGFKVVSFIAALALWSGFVGRGEYILDVEIGINYLVPSNYSLRSSPNFVKITLKGPEMAMKKFSRKSRTVDVNLTGKTPGHHQVTVTRELLDLPPGMQVLSVRPEVLNLEMFLTEGESRDQ
ncbi:MAG: hypothetical protein A4S09_10350 [Proteobacteria bacterium SG_bin7]|nr:MAG: hypothetical protein A4S09_10350 [Proteobacteria bacterium SG_bin7]